MEHDKDIKIVRVDESFRFPRDGNPVKVTVYKFFVGNHGPFFEEFLSNELSPETINFRLHERARLLRETGALG